MKRRGMGRGLGKGYKNLVPIDSHVHRMSAKGQKTFLQKLGIGVKPRGRPPAEHEVKIYMGDMSKLGGLVKERKKKKYALTQREKKISLATVGGAGVGFVVGGMTGGLLGMWAGVPIGTFAGNLIARKTIPQTGRKPYQKTSYLKSIWEDRQDIIREREDINAIERARAKSEREGKAMGVYAKGEKPSAKMIREDGEFLDSYPTDSFGGSNTGEAEIYRYKGHKWLIDTPDPDMSDEDSKTTISRLDAKKVKR